MNSNNCNGLPDCLVQSTLRNQCGSAFYGTENKLWVLAPTAAEKPTAGRWAEANGVTCTDQIWTHCPD